MVGINNGVYNKLKLYAPNLTLIRCVCHSAVNRIHNQWLELKTHFSASQSGKYSVTLHFRSREVRFPVQCQKFLVECGKNLVEYGKNVRTPLIYSFHSYFKIKVSIRYFNLV
jgi:hypothetical protein